MPDFDQTAIRDILLLPDERWLDLAKKAGWPKKCLALLPFPKIACEVGPYLTIIADTRAIESNPNFDLSSHQLLWDLIRTELQTPIVINDLPAYLHSRMKRLNVSGHGLDQRRFIEELIIPAYQQSIATHLLQSKIPLRIFGRGWCEMSEFVSLAAGPISSRQELHQALSTSCALIHPWPGDHPHPIDTAGPPVIRFNSRGISALIADARLAMAGKLIKPAPPAADSSKATIARILGAVGV